MLNKKHDIRNNKAYESADGFSTSIWGAPLWHILHVISFNYPVRPTDEDKLHYKQFIMSLKYVLPCRACRENYFQNLKDVKFSSRDLKNRYNFSRFIYRLRQEVNNKIGKGKLPTSYYKTRHAYECFRAQCKKTTGNERGCTEPKHYVKSRIVMKIAPLDQLRESPSLDISKECFNVPYPI